MLHFYTGTDREKARTAMDAAVKSIAKKDTLVVRISDANTPADFATALQGSGMFAQERVVVFDSILANEEMRWMALDSLKALKESDEHFFMLEERPDAATRKQIEKYAEDSERFDALKQKEASSIFALANALKRGDKKGLWVAYQRELGKGSAPEAVHGILFWGAKDMFMKASEGSLKQRAKKLIAELAELPHESRRRGEELEYALERFVLSGA